jgi:hypothetical protein
MRADGRSRPGRIDAAFRPDGTVTHIETPSCPTARGRLRSDGPIGARVRRTTSVVLVAAVSAALSACASVPKADRTAGAASAGTGPRISWEIRSGGEFGDARTVCSSSQPRPDCSLSTAREGGRNLATVRVYLHAAERETRYLGSVAAPFVAGSSHGSLDEISMSVPSNSSPVGATLNGLVIREPGVYQLDIALDALQAGDDAPVRLARVIPVTVTSAATP